MEVVILGCGASTGVPVIGCNCLVCTGGEPKNNRSRSSVLLKKDGFHLLIDAGPDFRQQMLREKVTHIDAVIFTHVHADHINGMDDIRPFNMLKNKEIPCYATEEVLTELQTRFGYIFAPFAGDWWWRSALIPYVVNPYDKLQLGPFDVQLFLQYHGAQTSLGIRVGDFAYSTDVHDFPPETEMFLSGLNTWVLDCLRVGEAGSHFNLSRALEVIKRFAPQRAILTHMNHEMDYNYLQTLLPEGVEPAYDGLYLGF